MKTQRRQMRLYLMIIVSMLFYACMKKAPCSDENILLELAKQEVSLRMNDEGTPTFSDITTKAATENKGATIEGKVEGRNISGTPIRASFTVQFICVDGKPKVDHSYFGEQEVDQTYYQRKARAAEDSLVASIQNDAAEAEETLTATELVKAYIADETKAGQRFVDRVLEISGTVHEVSGGGDKSFNLLIESDSPSHFVWCDFDPSVVPAVKKGDLVSVKGVCIGYTGYDVSLKHCAVLKR